MVDFGINDLASETITLEPRLSLDELLELASQSSDSENNTDDRSLVRRNAPSLGATPQQITDPTENRSISLTDPEDPDLPMAPGANTQADDAQEMPSPVMPNTIDRADDGGSESTPMSVEPPMFVVIENADSATTVGSLGSLFPDSDGAVSYQLTDSSDGLFVIEDDQIQVALNAQIDFESARSHEISIEAVMETGDSETFNVTISVENVVEVATVDVVRLFNTESGDHLFTTSSQEVEQATTPSENYQREFVGFKAVATSDIAEEGAAPVYRIFDTKLGAHFFTVSEDERDQVLSNGSRYVDEGIAFGAFTSQDADGGLVDVYRLFNLDTGRHHWTTSREEVDQLDQSNGWQLDGTAFYAFATNPDQAEQSSSGTIELADGEFTFDLPEFDEDITISLPGELLIA